jgi:endonuclease/exonuclease/phosphatase (EEP) superfamily protein YafD
MTVIRRRFGWTLVLLSLVLHLVTVFAFSVQPDKLAAFTVVPIWIWGGVGLLFSTFAFYFLRAPLSLILTGVWALTILVGSDEVRALGNLGKEAPKPGPAAPYRSKNVLRVLTMNTAMFQFGDPSDEIAAWNPDVVLLQQTMPQDVRKIATRLYQGGGDLRTFGLNGVITRWKVERESRNHLIRNQQLTLALPDGTKLQVVNLHLSTAATDLRLWNRSAWKNHRDNRVFRKQEISLALQILSQTTNFPAEPTIFGGDFNASATDVVHRHLTRDFVDAFSEAGTGWGDTFHNRFPILRIDHIYTTRHLTPVRCRAVKTKHSDHRFVVADFLMR